MAATIAEARGYDTGRVKTTHRLGSRRSEAVVATRHTFVESSVEADGPMDRHRSPERPHRPRGARRSRMMLDLAPLAYALALAVAFATLAYMARLEDTARRHTS